MPPLPPLPFFFLGSAEAAHRCRWLSWRGASIVRAPLWVGDVGHVGVFEVDYETGL